MRPILIALLVAACASVPETPDRLVAGCWVDRGAAKTSFMRWRADAASGGWLGDTIEYGANGNVARRGRYSLAPNGAVWMLCDVSDGGQACWQVAQGPSGSLEGGRAFVDAYSDRLRITVVGAEGGDRHIFEGMRDGCD